MKKMDSGDIEAYVVVILFVAFVVWALFQPDTSKIDSSGHEYPKYAPDKVTVGNIINLRCDDDAEYHVTYETNGTIYSLSDMDLCDWSFKIIYSDTKVAHIYKHNKYSGNGCYSWSSTYILNIPRGYKIGFFED